MEKKSPFIPGTPVPADSFVGNMPLLKQLYSLLNAAKVGAPKHVFVLGETGTGKSSVVQFMAEFAQRPECKFFALNVSLAHCPTADEAVRLIYEALLKANVHQTWFAKVRAIFDPFIHAKGQLNVSYSFDPAPEKLADLGKLLPDHLNTILKATSKARLGFLICLDDMGRLSSNADFLAWYLAFAQHLQKSFPKLPVMMMGTGSDADKDKLLDTKPLLGKFLEMGKLEVLTYVEAKSYVVSALSKLGQHIDGEALEALIAASRGIPLYLQQVGDAAFWLDTDNRISLHDVDMAGHVANVEVGKRHLPPDFLQTLKKKAYHPALNVMGSLLSRNDSGIFSRSDLLATLDANDRQAAQELISKLMLMGVVTMAVPGDANQLLVPQRVARNYFVLNEVKSPFDLMKTISNSLIQGFAQQP